MTIHKSLAFEQAANIVKFFEAATSAEIDGGLSWYADVRSLVTGWARYYAATRKRVAGVVAVLSPNTPWEKNLEYAHNAVANWEDVPHKPLEKTVEALKDFGVTTFNTSIEKAYKILSEGDFSQVSGQKVRSFWSNIYDVNSTAITHDVHSRRVVFNNTDLLSKAITPKYYRTAEVAYHYAFDIISQDVPELEHPYQLQAITWEVARRLRNEGVVSL